MQKYKKIGIYTNKNQQINLKVHFYAKIFGNSPKKV